MQEFFLTSLGLNIKISQHVIKAGDMPLEEYTAIMIDLGMYKFKYFNAGNITPN